MVEDKKEAYSFEINGERGQTMVSLKEALLYADWDIITVQQVSTKSAFIETYFPYLTKLVEYVKEMRPKAKIFVHETWAYEDGSERLQGLLGYTTSGEMLSAVTAAYKEAEKMINADGFIPSGEAMGKAVSLGMKVHRDTFHASFGKGRYLLALVWYKALLGADITNNAFLDFDEEVTEEERKKVILAVNSVF
jgi:hypothetical protein